MNDNRKKNVAQQKREEGEIKDLGGKAIFNCFLPVNETFESNYNAIRCFKSENIKSFFDWCRMKHTQRLPPET